jgi:hypothetical protein
MILKLFYKDVLLNIIMSWFKRKPRIKEPVKHLPHHRTSPASEKMLDEAKKLGPEKTSSKKKHKQ